MKHLTNRRSFLSFICSKDHQFMAFAFYSPLLIAVVTFFISYLIKKVTLSESLLSSGFTFLFSCFIGLIYIIVSRKR